MTLRLSASKTSVVGELGGMFDEQELFRRYQLDGEKLESVGLELSVVKSIYSDYIERRERLEIDARYYADILRSAPGVHSVKYRTKDPYRLIEKLYRKRELDPERVFTLENYTSEIQDLVALRALHLYKSDWQGIAEFVQANFSVSAPVIYVRNDEEKTLYPESYRDYCDVHRDKYRSIHYNSSHESKSQISYYSEIQIRTLIEEAWSEIDHKLRYSAQQNPDEDSRNILSEYIAVFNYFCGGADTMGTYASNLSGYLATINAERRERQLNLEAMLAEKNAAYEELKAALFSSEQDKRELQAIVKRFEESSSRVEESIVSTREAKRSFRDIVPQYHNTVLQGIERSTNPSPFTAMVSQGLRELEASTSTAFRSELARIQRAESEQNKKLRETLLGLTGDTEQIIKLTEPEKG